MRVNELRGYGVAFSDLEALWPPALKARMKKVGMAVVLERLSLAERLRFFWAFARARRRAARLDLSDLRARGLNNETFLAQQREYLAMFAALAEVVGSARALEIATALMDATAREPMLLCLPEADAVRALGDPFEVFRAYFRPVPEATRRAGCQDIALRDEGDVIGFDVTWCVWLELARRMGVPEACLPNCYSDEIAFPKYFQDLGIAYRRAGTLAGGARCCDFRFSRLAPADRPADEASRKTMQDAK